MNTLLFLLEPLINAVYYLYSKACIYEELNILNSCETIESIINDKLSISRFGDGEMKIIRGHGIGFQKYSPELSSRLQEVLQSNMKKHMVCVLHVIRGDFDMYKPSSVLFWKYNMHNLNFLFA